MIEPADETAQVWRCEHYAHDRSRCTPTKHYGINEPKEER